MLDILLGMIAKGATLQQALEKIEKDYNLSPRGMLILKDKYKQINEEYQWTR